MKQVIVRLRDCRVNKIKTLKKAYYSSQAQYEYYVYKDFKDLMPGQEIYVKIGNRYSFYLTYEEIVEYAKIDNTTFDEELNHYLTNNMVGSFYIKEYLPEY